MSEKLTVEQVREWKQANDKGEGADVEISYRVPDLADLVLSLAAEVERLKRERDEALRNLDITTAAHDSQQRVAIQEMAENAELRRKLEELVESARAYQDYHDAKFYEGLPKPIGLRPAIGKAVRYLWSIDGSGAGDTPDGERNSVGTAD